MSKKETPKLIEDKDLEETTGGTTPSISEIVVTKSTDSSSTSRLFRYTLDQVSE